MSSIIIQLQKIPKWFWLMIAIGILLISAGFTFNLNYRGTLGVESDVEEIEKEIIREMKK